MPEIIINNFYIVNLVCQVLIYVLIFLVRFAGYGAHHGILRRPVSGLNNEIFRAGSDLSLMSLAIFSGTFFVSGRATILFLFYFLCILVTVFLNYFFYLFLHNKSFNDIWRQPRFLVVFLLSLFVGWESLSGAVDIVMQIKAVITE
jgi:hypothetical protein